ncbi:hypothetical protein StoSoilA2_24270 [Arthrobacter sp. StoSoilA2]|uniref:hypothetical protein n=1 Tax=Arthrobacter sp. StoSoilA2 TaxID=2830990 RepID=UPI001CC3F91C|nr:hypothetical protein [Arthrobacter sp. StoSoilA2]BCW36371.1 hypothetical protein StoSoilA2_24270 [Arthrobacter sp. StoSoilA2]
MQLGTVLKSLKRRWYFVLTGIILSGVFCFAIQFSTPEKYKAQASIVLLPSTSSVGDSGNPYLKLGGMGEALDILTRKLSSEEVRARIGTHFGTSSYTAEPDRGTSGAILLITAVSSSPEETLRILETVVDQTPLALGEMQDALVVPATSRISTMKLLVDRQATPEVKARTQLLLVSGAGGIGLTLVLTVIIDGLILSRGPKGTPGVGDPTIEGEHCPQAVGAIKHGHALRTMRAGTATGPISPVVGQATEGPKTARRTPGSVSKAQELEELVDEVPRAVPSSQRPV